jgi:hypothetical protein
LQRAGKEKASYTTRLMPPIWFMNCIPYASMTRLPVWTSSRLKMSRHLYSPCLRSSSIASRISFCCCETFGSSGPPSQTSHKTCSASSLRPWAYSQRGDSGIPNTRTTTTYSKSVTTFYWTAYISVILAMANATWQAIGTRHATDPGTKLMP